MLSRLKKVQLGADCYSRDDPLNKTSETSSGGKQIGPAPELSREISDGKFSVANKLTRETSISAKLLHLSGLLLVLSGGFHILIWMWLGGTWEGPVSWRKPILFGFSTGVTLLSIAWFFDKLKVHKFDVAISSVLSIALVLEVGLITLQQWRGQASHFNQTTVVNSWIEHMMTLLIVLATVALCHITYRSFVFLGTPKDLTWSIRGGLGFLLLSCLIGFGLLYHGQLQIAEGNNPSLLGEEGVTKFPHGVAIHALQLFPILCYFFARLGLSLPQRVSAIRYSIASMGSLLIYSLVQTLLGKSRFDLNVPGATLLALSILLLLPILWMICGGKQPKTRAASADSS